MRAAILTYHSQNIAGCYTSNNDHVALQADLEALHSGSWQFVSLDTLVRVVLGGETITDKRPMVCLTFDDGCNFDVRSLDFPGHGLQTGFLQIMENFVSRHGQESQPGLHATSFVIASPQARQLIDQKSLFGEDHISDNWWKDAQTHPLLSIGNHGWDHNHPDLEVDLYTRGGFEVIDTQTRCSNQVARAGDFIHQKTGCYPLFFAYPFGESSSYIRDQYFPLHGDEHRCKAALGTEPVLVDSRSNRWNLPRFVCGRDWSTPAELLRLLS